MGKRSAKRSCKDSLFRMVFREKKDMRRRCWKRDGGRDVRKARGCFR